jgi:Tc5 transposase DNA-binding domain
MHFNPLPLFDSTMATTTNSTLIELAIADLRAQDKPNYRATAKKYALDNNTLRRRFLGLQLSPAASASLHRQRLLIVQEKALIDQINRLTDRGLPPTSQMVRNLAEEMIQGKVGKNWTGEFVRRHQDVLKSTYLRNIDKQRLKSEYIPSYKYFYDLVPLSAFFSVFNCLLEII